MLVLKPTDADEPNPVEPSPDEQSERAEVVADEVEQDIAA